MAKFNTVVNEDGSSSVEIVHDDPVVDLEGKPVQLADGSAMMQTTRWGANDARHSELLSKTWAAHPAIPKGEGAAIADQVNEVLKQLRS